MADNRQLKRADRQLMLARIARRDAIASLAQSLAEEQRSASLADRSRRLAKVYGARPNLETGEALARHRIFAGELAGLARQADQARGDAFRQVQWQAEALARADHRIERLDERAKLVRSEHRNTQERLEQQDQAAMARSLQKRGLNWFDSNQGRKPR